jgi:hypothetical protein
MEDTRSQSSDVWRLFGHKFPRSEIVYFSQVLMIFIIILTSLGNLTIGSEYQSVWIALLTSNLGILLPNPKIKKSGSGLHAPTAGAAN